ncbi:MAG: hypothetical protein AAGI66_02300 [Cyanobacteria bacterium P01_H01_bin.74]
MSVSPLQKTTPPGIPQGIKSVKKEVSVREQRPSGQTEKHPAETSGLISASQKPALSDTTKPLPKGSRWTRLRELASKVKSFQLPKLTRRGRAPMFFTLGLGTAAVCNRAYKPIKTFLANKTTGLIAKQPQISKPPPLPQGGSEGLALLGLLIFTVVNACINKNKNVVLHLFSAEGPKQEYAFHNLTSRRVIAARRFRKNKLLKKRLVKASLRKGLKIPKAVRNGPFNRLFKKIARFIPFRDFAKNDIVKKGAVYFNGVFHSIKKLAAQLAAQEDIYNRHKFPGVGYRLGSSERI